MATVRAVLQDGADFEPFSEIAEAVTGDAIATNMMMLGYAWQQRPDPARGRLDRHRRSSSTASRSRPTARPSPGAAGSPPNPPRSTPCSTPTNRPCRPHSTSSSRTAALSSTGYQGKRLARRYRALVDRVAAASREIDSEGALPLAVARNYFKLLSYKDEYEVARLYTDGEFERRLAEQFEGDFKLALHLAPPLLARPDPDTGRPRKRRFGRWMLSSFRVLARLRFLRGTPLDPFGYSAERREERRADRGLRSADR